MAQTFGNKSLFLLPCTPESMPFSYSDIGDRHDLYIYIDDDILVCCTKNSEQMLHLISLGSINGEMNKKMKFTKNS